MNINELGAVIRDSRKERQMTQAELSELLGMSRATLSALENGTIRELGICKVIAICSVLGLELVAQQVFPASQRAGDFRAAVLWFD